MSISTEDIMTDWINEIIENESSQSIDPECQTKMKWDREHKGLWVGFHGFSAGTYQLRDIMDHLTASGGSYILLRLPGNGALDDNGHADYSKLPTYCESHRYTQFIKNISEKLETIDEPLSLCGLSAGGTVALRIAQGIDTHHLILGSPFFGIGSLVGKYAMDISEFWPFNSRWLAHKMDSYRYNLEKVDGLNNPLTLPGHATVSLGNIRALHCFGCESFRCLDPLKTKKVTLFSSDWDTTADIAKMHTWANRIQNTSIPISHIRFPKFLKVPHALLSKCQVKSVQYKRILTFL